MKQREYRAKRKEILTGIGEGLVIALNNARMLPHNEYRRKLVNAIFQLLQNLKT